MEPAARPDRILIIDDLDANIRILRALLQRGGYVNIADTTDPREALRLFREYRPDLVMLDLHMPYLDGFEVMDLLRQEIGPDDYLPILVLTADATPASRERALASGAQDFLAKPWSMTELLLRVGNLLQTRRLHRAQAEVNDLLEARIRERTEELEEAQLEIIHRLATAADFRDDDTGAHARRLGAWSAVLARGLGLPRRDAELYRFAAPLHDIGKLGAPDQILLKPGKLTPEEYEEVKRHTVDGAQILAGSRFPVIQLAEEIALTHHEHWDGSGYPAGLRGEQIPLAGRIVAVVDVFDALTHERPYKRAWSVDEAVAELRAQRGRMFDPAILDRFLELLQAGAFSNPDAGQTLAGAA